MIGIIRLSGIGPSIRKTRLTTISINSLNLMEKKRYWSRSIQRTNTQIGRLSSSRKEVLNPGNPGIYGFAMEVHAPFTPADRHLEAYNDVTTPKIPDVYPPRPGKPEYMNQMEFWKPGPNGEPVEKGARGSRSGWDAGSTWPTFERLGSSVPARVLAIDEGVGRLLEALQESGQDENTIIIFTSDQGFAWGQHGSKSKVAPYRANIAAPLIFRLPEEVASKSRSKGTVVTEPVTAVDIPVTLFSLTGLRSPWKMHGYDLSPLLKDPEAPWGKPSMLVHTAKQYGSDTDTIPPKGDPKLYHGPGVPWYVLLSQGRYKYIRTLIEGETEELYDVVSDSQEVINLAENPAYSKILRQYRKWAIDELKRTDAGFVNKLPTVANH